MRLRNLYQSYSVYYTGKIPVFCGDTEAWLGHGHYFWDSFVDDAHWWGHAHYHGDYSICQSSYDYDSFDFFDLVGNTEHIAAFEKCVRILQKRYTGGRQLKVYDVLGFMKVVNKSFRFKAYRAWPIPEHTSSRKFFYDQNQGYFYIRQTKIQMCVTELDFLEEDCKIIFTSSIDPHSVV